jgi:hypothetical protein
MECESVEANESAEAGLGHINAADWCTDERRSGAAGSGLASCADFDGRAGCLLVNLFPSRRASRLAVLRCSGTGNGSGVQMNPSMCRAAAYMQAMNRRNVL